MKRYNFFKLVEKSNAEVFWNGVHTKPLGGNRISIMDKQYDMLLIFQNILLKQTSLLNL